MFKTILSTSYQMISCRRFTIAFALRTFHFKTQSPFQVAVSSIQNKHNKRGLHFENMTSLHEDKEFILESEYNPTVFPNLTSNSICDYLLEKAKENAKNGRNKWITNTITGETVTYSELDEMSAKVASYMYKRGMRKGDKALYLTTDVTRIFVSMVGIWRLGGIMCSSYPEDTFDTLLTRIKDLKARWIYCDPESVGQCQTAAKQVDWPVEIIVFGMAEGCTSVDTVFNNTDSECPNSLVSNLDDPILILCTSGTTGMSKGAIYTNRSVLALCLGTDGVPRNNPRPAMWLLRCTHVLGVLYPMRNIFVGDWSIMMHKVTKQNIFNAVDTYKPFLGFGFPTYLMLLATDPEATKYDMSSIEIVATGGMVITEKFYTTMMTLPNIKYVINGFGMTECGALVTTVDISESAQGFRAVPNIPPLSVGKLYPNTMMKVLDMDTGKPVGPDTRGELCFKSPIMSSGYWNRPEENEKTFKDGWLRTGDLGYYDQHGFVFVVGRIKETFKYFNNHISPSELEHIILQHPAIAEVCVFGIQDPDGGDHIPRAACVLKLGETATEGEIKAFVHEKVATYKQLRGGVYFFKELPRGNTGKVVRSMVAALNYN